MSSQIVPTNGNATLKAMTDRLKLMVQNGKNLSDNEAAALAQYSLATNLNPFAYECYYLPGIGPGPGIAGWRKKAEEQLEYEAKRAAEPMARFWCEPTEPTEGEVGKLQPGDIAVKMILHDTLTKNAWERRILSHYIELVKNGIKDGAWETASTLVGPEPVWTGLGIVRQTENFGRDNFPRYERACKRGEKAAIRKRFTRVHLPEPEGFEEADIVDSTFVEVEQSAPKDEAQLMAELGFGEMPEPTYQMSLDEARNTKTPMGQELGTLTKKQLETIVNNPHYQHIAEAIQICLNAMTEPQQQGDLL